MGKFKPQQPVRRKKIKVLFVITTIGHNVKSDVTKFLAEVTKNNYAPDHPFEYGTMFVEDYRPVDYARNIAVQNFLNTEGDVLWFIDYDMVPPINSLDMLGCMFGLNADGSWTDRGIDMVVPRMYGIRNKQLFPCVFKYNDAVQKDVLFSIAIPSDANGMIPVDAAGTGFLAIRRRVFEDPRCMVHNKEGDPKGWFLTEYWPWGMVKQSEDLSFTSRATKAGYKLMCLPSVKVGHWKEVDLADLENSPLSSEMDGALKGKPMEARS